VIPFRLVFKPGIPVHEQAKFAAKKAVISGQLRPGDPFPSVRALSAGLKINPNTAHKVITQLINEGFLEVRPGIGTTVAAELPPGNASDRARLVGSDLEQLIVEAKRLGLTLQKFQAAVEEQWRRLEPGAHRDPHS
jgi:GntR family transcriptional regulator